MARVGLLRQKQNKKFSGMLRRVDCQTVDDVSKDCNAFHFRVTKSKISATPETKPQA
jgi:uncharacterized protein (DUF736 family)